MILFSLKCAQSHQFESWFPSGDAYEAQRGRGLVQCAVCGTTDVEKTLMAPAVRASRKAKDAAPVQPVPGPLSSPPSDPREQALAELRRMVEANSDYVGMNFVTEARRIHSGNAPERAIYGEAKPHEARQLIEDGVPVAPLPFLPTRKAN
jgi:hypothetical protein